MNEFQVRTIAKEEANKLGCQVSCLMAIFGLMFMFLLVAVVVIEPDIIELTLNVICSDIPVCLSGLGHDF